MRTWITLLLLSMILAGTLWGAVEGAEAQTPSQQPGYANSGAVTTVNEAIDRLIARERDEIAVIRSYKPITETYVQDMRSDPQLGIVPIDDHYFLGQADLSTGVGENSFLENNNNKKKKEKMEDRNSHKGGPSSSYDPEGFLRMIYVDTEGFDREHYTFDYGGRDVGEVRCLVFDVTPLRSSGKGRFYGRIWVEDQDFTIVRFNGVYTSGENPLGSPCTSIAGGGIFSRASGCPRLLQPGIGLEEFSGTTASASRRKLACGVTP